MKHLIKAEEKNSFLEEARWKLVWFDDKTKKVSREVVKE